MNTRKIELMPFSENVLLDGGMNEKLVSMMVGKSFYGDRFYLTGFESLSFDRDKLFAVKTVLSSTVGIDYEIVLVNSGDETKVIEDICNEIGIQYHTIDVDRDFSELVSLLNSNRRIKQILVCDLSDSEMFTERYAEIGKISGKYKVDLIYVCNQLLLPLESLIKYEISFMIGTDLMRPNQSFVISRRSRLVQSEGRSNSIMFDLHRYWQSSLASRKKIIEPMAV